MKYPKIEASQKSGEECFITGDKTLNETLLNYWKWAHSDLIDNTERGKLAEYIICMAIGTQNKIIPSWASYDLLSPEGIRIEVKTSAYIQTWGQKELSKLRFGIQPTQAYDDKTNTYDTEKLRQSDIYVFCVMKHTDQETINPMDLEQWEFYVMSTKILNEKCPNQKSVGIKKLINLGAIKCNFEDLYKTIKESSKF